MQDNRLSTDDLVDTAGDDRDVREVPEDRHEDQQESARDEQRRPTNGDEAPLELFGEDEVERFRVEWREIQARFVDDPREAVQGADQLVAEVMRSLATTFNEHKHELEGQWQHGSDAETEDLRQALRHYRTFFNQLLVGPKG